MRERKLQTRETLARSNMGGIHHFTQMEKKKTELQETLKACIILLAILDPDFATDSFK